MLIDWNELTNWGEYLKFSVALLAMVNPLDMVPLYLAIVKDFEKKLRSQVVLVGVLVFIVLLSLIAFIGDAMLALFEVTVHAFRVAGGILVLLIGIDMMRAAPGKGSMISSEAKPGLSVAIVPIGVPLLAGPGAVSTVIVFQDLHPSFSHSLLMTFVIIAVGILCYLVLRASNMIERVVGQTGMQVFNRVLGLIVATIGIEFILDGVAGHFPDLFNFEGHSE